MLPKVTGLGIALIAGVFGTLASVFSKLAFSSYWAWTLVCDNDYQLLKTFKVSNEQCEIFSYGLRLLFLLGMLSSNGIMWRCFAKALVLCNTSVEATLGSTASSFCISALLGWVLFGEKASLQWCVGIMFILLGLLVIHINNKTEKME